MKKNTTPKKPSRQVAWDKEHTKQIKAKLNENTDADILKHLESIGNVAGYIKELIRADMKKKETTK